MSGPGRPTSDPGWRDIDWPATAGQPGLAQGRYGSAGNVEAVVPAPRDGLYVGWFNADAPGSPPTGDTGPRTWSGLLHFAAGQRYLSAEVTQVAAGPDFLEVVGVTAGGSLRRHVWSPGPGFVEHGELAAGIATCSAVVQGPDAWYLAAVRLDGRLELLTGVPGADYPALRLEATTVAAGGAALRAVDAAWHDDHLDLLTLGRDDTLRLTCHRTRPGEGTDLELGAAAAARLVVLPGDGRVVITTGLSTAAGLDPDGRGGSTGPAPAARHAGRVEQQVLDQEIDAPGAPGELGGADAVRLVRLGTAAATPAGTSGAASGGTAAAASGGRGGAPLFDELAAAAVRLDGRSTCHVLARRGDRLLHHPDVLDGLDAAPPHR